MRTPQPIKEPALAEVRIIVDLLFVTIRGFVISSLLARSLPKPCVSYTNHYSYDVKRLQRVAVLLLVTLAGCGVHGNGAGAAAKTVVIGADFATSGIDASAGVPTQNGVVLAVEDEQKKGLPGGYTLRLDTLDDSIGGVHNPEQGALNVQTFVADPDVLAVIGPQNSNVARAEIPVTNAAELAQISPSSTSIGLTDDASGARSLRQAHPELRNFFRTVMRDDMQGAADAQFAYVTLGARRTYVIDDNESYGKGLADVFVPAFQKLGGTIIDRAHLTKGQQDFIALLTSIESTKPDLIFYGGVVSTGGAQLRRQMLKLGITSNFMGGDGLKDPGFLTAGGTAANGTYTSQGAPNLSKLPEAKDFLAEYAARFPGQLLGTYSANSYAAAEVAIDAIRNLMEHNGGVAPSREQVLRAISASSTPNTPLGPISFNKLGDVTTPVVSMWIVRDGQFVFLSQERAQL
jgi:branched-chain amino acid transport system substrate-binding protein